MDWYNWIDARDYSMECLLLFDRWALQGVFTDCSKLKWFPGKDRDYKRELAKAMHQYPYIYRYVAEKAPECRGFLRELQNIPNEGWTKEEMRDAETYVLQCHELTVCCYYPEVMNQQNYIRNWDEKYLHDLVDFTDMTVLDVGAGTGRLTFAAAKKAKRVYACDPSERMREYLRDRTWREKIGNVWVVDGFSTVLPYEDDTFDAVISGHIIGYYLKREIAEITRVTKNGGWLVLCSGDDPSYTPDPYEGLLLLGFEWRKHDCICQPGVVYDYFKQVKK